MFWKQTKLTLATGFFLVAFSPGWPVQAGSSDEPIMVNSRQGKEILAESDTFFKALTGLPANKVRAIRTWECSYEVEVDSWYVSSIAWRTRVSRTVKTHMKAGKFSGSAVFRRETKSVTIKDQWEQADKWKGKEPPAGIQPDETTKKDAKKTEICTGRRCLVKQSCKGKSDYDCKNTDWEVDTVEKQPLPAGGDVVFHLGKLIPFDALGRMKYYYCLDSEWKPCYWQVYCSGKKCYRSVKGTGFAGYNHDQKRIISAVPIRSDQRIVCRFSDYNPAKGLKGLRLPSRVQCKSYEPGISKSVEYKNIRCRVNRKINPGLFKIQD